MFTVKINCFMLGRFIKLCVFFSVFTFIFPSCYAQTAEENFSDYNLYFDSLNRVYKQQQFDSLFRCMVKEKGFNGVMLVAQGNQILYENVAGFANFSTKELLDLHASFEIASLSKMFTAAAILQLCEAKKMNINQLVTDFFPDFPYKTITVHHLLCHRSGLPEYFNFAGRYHKNRLFPLTNDSLLSMIQKYKPKCAALPDKKFDYNNTGYAILASIVEKVSGVSFEQYLKTHFFEPLGMKETFLYRYGSDQKITMGHWASKRVYIRDYLSGVVGDKGIFSSMYDLHTWEKALFFGNIISKESLAHMSFPQHSDMSDCSNYGYGLRLSCDDKENPLLFHGGLWNGNHNLFVHRPSDSTLIVFLSNVFNRSFTWRSSDILRILDEL